MAPADAGAGGVGEPGALAHPYDFTDMSRDEVETNLREVMRYARALEAREAEYIATIRTLRAQLVAARRQFAGLVDAAPAAAFPHLPPLRRDVEEREDRVGRHALGAVRGVGGSGVVRATADGRFAVKILAKAAPAFSLARLDAEIELLRAVDGHPNVARLVEAIQTPTRFYLVLEDGGASLHALVYAASGEGMAEATARPLIAQLVAADAALARSGIVHHDLKPENVLVDASGRLRVADLGLGAKYARGEAADVLRGSLGFFAPEMVTSPPVDPFKVDVWSIGCVALELLLGGRWFARRWLPASAEASGDVRAFDARIRAAAADVVDALDAADATLEAADFLVKALCVDPGARPDVDALAACDWLRQ